MKTLTSLLAAVVLVTPVALSAANFEGKVTMTMSDGRDMNMPMTFSIKDGRTRIDMQVQGMSSAMIMDQAKQEMLMLMPQQNMYMVHPIPKANEAAAQNAGDATVEKTNEHEKILGYDTTKYIARNKDSTSEVWITDQLGTFMGTGSGASMGPGNRRGRGSQQAAWENAFRGKDAFPLRVITKMADGKQTFRMEATSIEKQSLPDSLFQPPPGYQKFDMGNMMRGMGIPGMPGRPQKQQGD